MYVINRKGPQGSIPARAGEPVRQFLETGDPRVYPRACGGAIRRTASSSIAGGLSPRVRGSRVQVTPIAVGGGSIPARAGEPLPD